MTANDTDLEGLFLDWCLSNFCPDVMIPLHDCLLERDVRPTLCRRFLRGHMAIICKTIPNAVTAHDRREHAWRLELVSENAWDGTVLLTPAPDSKLYRFIEDTWNDITEFLVANNVVRPLVLSGFHLNRPSRIMLGNCELFTFEAQVRNMLRRRRGADPLPSSSPESWKNWQYGWTLTSGEKSALRFTSLPLFSNKTLAHTLRCRTIGDPFRLFASAVALRLDR